jgi:Circularly permutated YpsA SLOG family
MAIRKIISGGQAGVDQAALRAALAWGVPTGGWVPAGRASESGKIPSDLPGLVETDSEQVEERTRLNVRDSDGTLILSHGVLAGGSSFTWTVAQELNKPVIHIDLNAMTFADAISVGKRWVNAHNVNCINVAGARASEDPGGYDATLAFVSALLAPTPTCEELTSIQLTECWNNFRHWDTQRWAVTSWFIALAAALMAISTALGQRANREQIMQGAWALSFFGVLCVLLQFNLIRYHNSAVATIRRILVEHGSTRKNEPLPFAFTWRDGWKTATFGFVLALIVATCFCLIVATTGPWWLE